jgi:DNA-binding CsgD family transcriptional regulator
MSLDAFGASLHLLYSSASDASLWTKALESLEDLTGCGGANLNLVPTSAGGQAAILTGRLSPESCDEYVETYMSMCPRMAYAHRHKPDLLYDALLLTEAEMDRDPVYDFYSRQGFRYHIGSALPKVGNHEASFSFQRTARQGHVQAAEIDLFKRIRPHLTQALTLADALGSLRAHEQLSWALLNRLTHGVIVVGDQLDLMFANTKAEDILSRGRHLRTRNGELEACSQPERLSFRQLVSAAISATSSGTQAGGGWLRLHGAAPLEPPLAVFAAPLTDAAQLSFTARPAAAIIMREIGKPANSTPEMLRVLFGLTRTEAKLAALLASGETLQLSADRLGQTASTARIHLKSVFRKMDINRQQDLVGIVATLSSPLG